MVSWQDVVTAEPEFAGQVREVLDAHKHKTLATVRRDGGPRISGTEISFHFGELWLGSMPRARKARDLQRDPRFAVHSASVMTNGDRSTWPGDAKLSGLAEELVDRTEIDEVFRARGMDPAKFSESHMFRCDIREVVLTRVVGGQLQIDRWCPGEKLQRFFR